MFTVHNYANRMEARNEFQNSLHRKFQEINFFRGEGLIRPCIEPTIPGNGQLPHFILVAAVMVEAGAAVDRGTTGFGKMETVSRK